ncbi:MAG: DNA-binding protein [Chitinophagaceae bacterium]|nr:MAG: DNA-binding protein [Chitinophagaceae bacterium]
MVKRYLLIGLLPLLSCHSKMTKTHALRLRPGADLRTELQAFANKEGIEAGWIATCAGSLTHYNIRFANQQQGSSGSGHFEIVSLTGTLSKNGSHIHLSIADSTGRCIGGHLLEGNRIYTTAEIVIQEDPSLVFTREKDGTTPWEELQVKKK